MQEFPLKLVLLEYSPTSKTVVVRYCAREGRMPSLPPIHEGNVQSIVRVHENWDNNERAIAFTFGGIEDGREKV